MGVVKPYTDGEKPREGERARGRERECAARETRGPETGESEVATKRREARVRGEERDRDTLRWSDIETSRDQEGRNRHTETRTHREAERWRDTCRDRKGDTPRTAAPQGGQSTRWGRGGGRGRKRVRRKYIPASQAALQRGSRSVRKWSFNGLPSPRQICHLSRLGGSPRAFHLLITSFQQAPSIPCLVPISSSAPRLDAPQAPRPIFQRPRLRPEPGAEKAQSPGFPPPTRGSYLPNLASPHSLPPPPLGWTSGPRRGERAPIPLRQNSDSFSVFKALTSLPLISGACHLLSAPAILTFSFPISLTRIFFCTTGTCREMSKANCTLEGSKDESEPHIAGGVHRGWRSTLLAVREELQHRTGLLAQGPFRTF